MFRVTSWVGDIVIRCDEVGGDEGHGWVGCAGVISGVRRNGTGAGDGGLYGSTGSEYMNGEYYTSIR